MVSNCEYFRTVQGTLKCVSITLISTTLILSWLGTLTSEYVKNRKEQRPVLTGDEVNLWREICLLVSTAVCLILSVLNFSILSASKNIYWDRRTGIYDFFYHIFSFLILSTAGVLNVVSAVKLMEINCTPDNGCQKFGLKAAGGVVALISAVTCGIIAAVVLTNRKYVERDDLLDDVK